MGKKNISLKSFKKMRHYNNIIFLFKKNFIGKLVKKGNKAYALNYLSKFKHLIKSKFKKDFNLLLFFIMSVSMIKFHFIKKRFGGSKKEIPIYLNKVRQIKFIVKKMFNHSKSLEKRKSLDLFKLANLFLLTVKKKGALLINKRKSFIKAKENKILVKSLKR